MKLLSLLLSITLCINSFAVNYSFDALGQVHYVEKDQAKEFNGHQWFFVVQNKGKTYFYPLKINNMSKNVKKGDFVKVEGALIQEKFNINEREISLTVLNAKKLEKLKLSTLSASSDTDKFEPKFKLKQSNNEPGIAVSDKVAESVIFTAGAILLGTILKNVGDK